jgi:hypothetical protein
VVEGTPLLRAHTGNGIEGSNPFVSATTPVSIFPVRIACNSRAFSVACEPPSQTETHDDSGFGALNGVCLSGLKTAVRFCLISLIPSNLQGIWQFSGDPRRISLWLRA